MGGVWGREEETEDEETAEEEEEEEEEEEREHVEEEEDRKEGVSYEDEEVNRALVVNIKEKISKLEETVRFQLEPIILITMRMMVFKVIEKEASLVKKIEAIEVSTFLLFFSLSCTSL